MANKDDYLTYYREFFENFAQSVDPNDQLPVKLASYKLVNIEVVGGIIDWATQYLTQKKCPPNLVALLIKIVIEEIRKACKKQPMSCGFNPADNAYEPLKLMQQVVAKTNEVCLRYLDNSMLCSLPAPGTPYGVTSAYAVKNSRRRMEDRHVVIHDLNTMFNIQDSSPSSYYAIFDGHGGHDAAAYSAAHLHQYLAENKHFVTNPKQALLDAFCKTDALFVDKCKVENLVSGTTALVALLCPKAEKLYVAWAGDSLGMLVSRGNIIKLVNPHKPIRTDEKIRVEDQGGCVMMRAGTWRVNGHLAVSRAIGDADYKPFITAVPEIREINLNGGEDFLILASDGLWDCVFEESATWLVYNLICENPDDTDRISKYLIVSAREKGSLDNISVIVVFLREPSKIAAEARRGNPFTMDAISNGASTDNILSQKTESPLSDLIKQNGTNLSSKFLGEKESNGGQHVSEYFDDDDDFGPETDVDAVDDAVSPIEQIKAFGDSKDINNPFDEGVYNPFLEHQEKAALEMERNLQKQEESGEFEETRMAREETPTPPADAVHDVRGLVENTAESDSEDEWNYIKGDEANKENTSPEPETQVAEIPEEDDTMSGLNPNAAEFVPISPTRSIPSPACRTLINDQVISQSPKRPVQELDINLPNPSDFENEVKSRPSEVDSYSNGHNGDSDRTASSTDMEDILNGKNIDDIPEFQPGSTPKKVLPTDEFHFGPNAAPFTPVKLLDQSEAALSTKAIYGDESAATLDTSFNESIVTAEDTATDLNILNKESDPMSMSFYADKGETNPFDLNEVQVLPENLDDFLKQPESEQLNDTISDLPEHHPLEDLAKPRVFSLNNDDAIQVTDLDKKSYDDEKELASPLEPEKDVDISEKDSQEGAEEIDFSKTPEPTHENLFAGEFCDVSEKSSELGVGVLPPDVELISPEPRTESPQEVLSESKSPLPENVPRDVELLSPSPKPEIDGYLQNENPLEPKEATEVGDLLGQPEAAEVGDLLGQPEATEVGDLLGQPEATEVGDLLLEPEATEVKDLLEQPIAVEEIEPEDPPKQPEATEVSDLLKTSDATEALERLEAIEDNDSLKQPEETKVENLLDQPEAAEVGDLLKQDVVEVSHSLEKLQKPTDVGDLLGKPEDIEGIDLLQAETELSENKSPVCDASESKSSICDLPELKSPYSDEVVCGLPRDTEELESPESPVYTEPQLIEKAQVHFEQLCHPTEDIKVLESPREDDVTSSVKDDDDDDNSSQVKSPVHENVIEDSFVADESTICVGQETNGILSSPCEEPEVVSPKSIAETESVATTDVNSFLDRSLPPDVTSPLSPTEEQLEEMRKCVYSSGDQPTEELETVHPALSKCVYPLSTQSTGEEIDVKTENISPEFAEQTIVTPSEESKQGEALSVPPSEQPLVESVLEEKQESKELEKEMTAVGIASAVATGAAIAAVVSATKVEDKKKTTSKNPTASKSATTTSKAALKVSPATKTSSRPSSSPRVPLTKTGTTKPATTTAAAPKPATAKPPTKPRTTGPPKSADKKPLANGDVKSTVKSTLTSRRVTSETAATKTSTNPRPVTATSKSSPTKTAPSRPTLKPTTAAKPASATSRPATTTTSSTRTRPTTLTSKPLGSVSPSKTSSSTTRTTLTKVSPRTATAPPKPKSAPTSALTAKPKTPLANKTVGKAPVTEKQIKESANKLTASRSVTSTTRITAAKSTSSSVRRVESKTTSSATRTIQSKTTTTTMKSTTGKKPAEIIRNGPTKTKTTKIEKPKENGVSSTVVTEEITVVSNNTTIDSDPQLFKDNSPVDNKLIENTLIQTNAAD